MDIKNAEAKLKYYKKLLENKKDAYVLCKKENKEMVFYIMRNKESDIGLIELNCHLFDYSFTPSDIREITFLKEQNFIILDGRAYDIQTPFCVIDFNENFGDFIEINKEECVKILKKQQTAPST